MQFYEELNQYYEDVGQIYERYVEDCFGGLYNLFVSQFPNHSNNDLKEVFAVIAWELCKIKTDIDKLQYLRDPDRIPIQFIQPLIEFFGITNFPATLYPEDQRRFLSFALEIQKYRGTQHGLELLMKSFMPLDEVKYIPMYRRGLRRYYNNNDYTGGRRMGSVDSDYITQLSAGMPVDWRTAGVTSFPTGIYICVTVTARRTRRVIENAFKKVEPLIQSFMPEVGFYKLVFVNAWLDPFAVTDGLNQVVYEGEALTYGYGTSGGGATVPKQVQIMVDGVLTNLLINDNPVYYRVEE